MAFHAVKLKKNQLLHGGGFTALAILSLFGANEANAQTSPAACIAAGSSAAVSGSTCTWTADANFSGGNVSNYGSNTVSIPGSVADTPPSAIFNNERWGTMTYTIPGLTAGKQYKVNLFFAEQWNNNVGDRVFNVAINGTAALTNFDILSAAGGKNVAIEKSFTATADSSGKITVSFTAVVDAPKVNGIQVAPVAAPLPCIAAGSSASVSGTSCTWLADQYFSGGNVSNYGSNTVTIPASMTDKPPSAIFNNERWGAMTYTIPGLTAGQKYNINLLFAEQWNNNVGDRVFNVAINGASALTNFDILSAAGGKNIAIKKTFTATADSTGKVTVSFTAVVDAPKINGIQVSPAAQIVSCIASGSSSSVAGTDCTWSADQNVTGGNVSNYGTNTVTIPSSMADKPPSGVFNNERWGQSTYTIPNLQVGSEYKVNLFFAEQWLNNAGARVFNVTVNNSQVLTNFDIFAASGGKNIAIEKTFTTAANSAGQIVIALTAVTDAPKINALQIASTGSGTVLQPTTMTFTPNITAMGNYSLAATSSSSAPIVYSVISGPASVSGNSLNVWSGGTIVLKAMQAANSTNLDASVTTTLKVDTPTSAQLNWSNLGGGTVGHNGSDSPNTYFIDKNGQFFMQNAYAQYDQVPANHNWSFFTGADEGNSASATNPAPANSYNSRWSVGGVARPDTRAICTSQNPVWTTFTSETGLTNGGGGFADGNFCDVIGVWVDPDTGDWYGIIHNELYPNAPRIDVLSLAISSNRGASWSMLGPILTNPYGIGDSRQYAYEYGSGDPRLYVDTQNGYFYIQYQTRAISNVTGTNTFLPRVARAPIRSKMAPSSWQTFYQGQFQAVPGIKWTCNPYTNSSCPTGDTSTSMTSNVAADNNPVNSEVFKWPLSTQSPSDTYFFNGYRPYGTSWSAYLGKYVSSVPDDTGAYINFFTTTDLASQQWTYAGQVPYNSEGIWYHWQRDTGTKSGGMTVGNAFDFMCTIGCDEGTKVSVSLKSGVAAPTYYTGHNGGTSATNTYVIQHPTASVPAVSGTGSTWQFTPVGDGFFYISQGTQYLTAPDGDAGRAWGAVVTRAAKLASTSTSQQLSRQQWYFEPVKQISGVAAPANRYRLVNRYSGLPLSFKAGGLTTSNVGSAVMAPNRDWDAATGAPYSTWKVADQTLIFIAQ